MTHLIIGGSGGIGEEIINEISKEDNIINLGRNAPKNLNNANLQHIEVDVLNDDLPDFENLDSLIYCPGTILLKPFTSIKITDFENDYQVNVLGAVRVLQKYIRTLKKNNGSVVLFSSVAAKVGMPFHSSISAAKGAIESLAKSLAAEYAPNLRVNVIAPTITDTPLAAGLLRNEKVRESTANRHPLNRFLAPKEIADLACYLISNKNKSVTGQIFGIDAGMGSLKV